MLKPFLRHPRTQAALAWLIWAYLAFALRTTRWTLQGEAHLAPHAAGRPAVAALWHECLPLMPALWLRIRRPGARAHAPRAYALASRHRDGLLLGAIMRRFGLGLVHGSSARNGQDKGGAAGVRALLAVLRAGSHVILTPDGPRGPAHRAAPGVAQLAALSGAPVLPCAARLAWAWRLPSWDRMILPLPFGRGVLVVGAAIPVPREGWEASLPAIEAALNEAARQASSSFLKKRTKKL
jgi:lysophospholipid acyltransferase (LPLAT)-like uncharacterized protein